MSYHSMKESKFIVEYKTNTKLDLIIMKYNVHKYMNYPTERIAIHWYWNDFAKSSSIHTFTYFSYLCDRTFDYPLISGDLFPPAGFEFSIKAIMHQPPFYVVRFDKISSGYLILASQGLKMRRNSRSLILPHHRFFPQ